MGIFVLFVVNGLWLFFYLNFMETLLEIQRKGNIVSKFKDVTG